MSNQQSGKLHAPKPNAARIAPSSDHAVEFDVGVEPLISPQYAAIQRTQTNRRALLPTEILYLQRVVGNQTVARLLDTESRARPPAAQAQRQAAVSAASPGVDSASRQTTDARVSAALPLPKRVKTDASLPAIQRFYAVKDERNSAQYPDARTGKVDNLPPMEWIDLPDPRNKTEYPGTVSGTGWWRGLYCRTSSLPEPSTKPDDTQSKGKQKRVSSPETTSTRGTHVPKPIPVKKKGAKVSNSQPAPKSKGRSTKIEIEPVVDETRLDTQPEIESETQPEPKKSPTKQPKPPKLSAKQTAKLKKEAKAERALRQKQLAQQKREAEQERVRKQATEDRLASEQLAATVGPKIEPAVTEAEAREVSVKTLRSAHKQTLSASNAKKPKWATVKQLWENTSTALDELLQAVIVKETQSEEYYNKAVGPTKESVKSAKSDAAKYKIDLTTLNQAVDSFKVLAKPPISNWTAAYASLREVTKAVNAIQEIVEIAVAYNVDKPDVLLLVEAAKQNGIEAKTEGDGPTKPAKYWDHLDRALKDLESDITRHDLLANADLIDWSALKATLKSMNVNAVWVNREVDVAPFRATGQVGRRTTSAKIEIQSRDAIEGDQDENEQESVNETLESIEGDGTWVGNKWGEYFGDAEGNLPTGNYKEYYVPCRSNQIGNGSRRIVIDSASGRIYYSWTHYGDNGKPAFVLLTD